MTTRRITIETIASGQPRAYADTINHVRVTFEGTDYRTGKLAPQYMGENRVREWLPRLECGFVARTQADKGSGFSAHFETHLEWLKPIDAKTAAELISGGDPTQSLASVWEFMTVTPYND